MTINTEISRSGPYAGAGTTGPFLVNFRILDAAHLRVVKLSAGIESTLAYPADYLVTGVGNPTSSLATTVAILAGETLTIIRDVPKTQEADYVQNDDFPAQSHEDALDKLTMIVQQIGETVDRSLTLPVSAAAASTELPAPQSNQLIGWNDAANGLQNVNPSTLATIVAFGTAKADVFTGTGAQTVFVLTANPGTQANLDVAVGGVTQLPGTDYTWVSGTTLTFTTAPPNGVKVLARYMIGLPQGYTTADQVVFDYSLTYPLGTVGRWLKDLATSVGSSLIGFIQAGIGAITRTVQAKLRDEINANDFGAIGDGSSHQLQSIASFNGVSTAGWSLAQWQAIYPHAVTLTDEIDWCAWQAAINYLNPYVFAASFNYNQGGGTVRGKRGTYLMSRSLRLASHVTLAGDGSQTYMAQATPTGPADGTIFMPVAAGFVGAAVIDSTGYVVSTGLRYAAAAPLTAGSFNGGTVTYTEGCGLRDLAVQSNGTTGLTGIRMQGSPGCKVKNVSAQGFAVNTQGICCWNSEWDLFNPGGIQISAYFSECHSSRITGEFDNSVISGVGNGVTSGNKPACWSAIDTVYVSTSLYIVNCLGLDIPTACSQHTGGTYVQNSHVHFGTWYNEDHGLSNGASGAYVTGAAMIRANNGSVSTTPAVYPATATVPNIVIDNMMTTANGSTFADSIYNANITVLAVSQPAGGAGLGLLYGSHTSTAQPLYVGPGVVRNANYPDTAYDARIVKLAQSPAVTWTPGTTNVGGSISSIVGTWVQRGNAFDFTIVINGTALTATGGGATVLSIPNGVNGFPAPARPSSVSVATANLQACGCGLMQTNANLYLPAITSTTQIVVSGTVWGA